MGHCRLFGVCSSLLTIDSAWLGAVKDPLHTALDAVAAELKHTGCSIVAIAYLNDATGKLRLIPNESLTIEQKLAMFTTFRDGCDAFIKEQCEQPQRTQ